MQDSEELHLIPLHGRRARCSRRRTATAPATSSATCRWSGPKPAAPQPARTAPRAAAASRAAPRPAAAAPPWKRQDARPGDAAADRHVGTLTAAAMPMAADAQPPWTRHDGAAATRALRARIARCDDDIAAIKTQIAAADLAPAGAAASRSIRSWFHRAKTALRHKQRERGGSLPTHGLAAERAETALKDRLIAVLRERLRRGRPGRGCVDEAHRRIERERA